MPRWGVASQPCSGRQCTPGDAPSRQDTVNVWSFFGQRRRLDSDRADALSCLECTSPAPTRLDQHRTVSRPFPDHRFTRSLALAQQRWQQHPGSQRNYPTVAITACVDTWLYTALPKCLLRLTSNRAQEIQTAFSIGCVRPTPCSHWWPCLGAVHTPRAARTARVRPCSPRHRAPYPDIGAPEAGRPSGSRQQPDGCRAGRCLLCTRHL